MRSISFVLLVLASSMSALSCAQIVGADFSDAQALGDAAGAPGSAGIGGSSGAGGASAGSSGSAGTTSTVAPATCASAGYEIGCCGSDGNAYYCSAGVAGMQVCAPGTCGFSDMTGQYQCGTSGAADPSGLRPQACGADAAGAQSACVDFESFTREQSGQCQQCLSQICMTEISGVSSCGDGEMACQTSCGNDTACYCTCALMQAGTCGAAEAAANRCIDFECRAACK